MAHYYVCDDGVGGERAGSSSSRRNGGEVTTPDDRFFVASFRPLCLSSVRPSVRLSASPLDRRRRFFADNMLADDVGHTARPRGLWDRDGRA